MIWSSLRGGFPSEKFFTTRCMTLRLSTRLKARLVLMTSGANSYTRSFWCAYEISTPNSTMYQLICIHTRNRGRAAKLP